MDPKHEKREKGPIICRDVHNFYTSRIVKRMLGRAEEYPTNNLQAVWHKEVMLPGSFDTA